MCFAMGCRGHSQHILRCKAMEYRGLRAALVHGREKGGLSTPRKGRTTPKVSNEEGSEAWNSREAVGAPSIETAKVRQHGILRT